jgi:hypothetical protein
VVLSLHYRALCCPRLWKLYLRYGGRYWPRPLAWWPRDMLFYNLALSASFGESRYTGKRRTPMVLKEALNVGRWGTLGKQYAIVICCATCAEGRFAVRISQLIPSVDDCGPAGTPLRRHPTPSLPLSCRLEATGAQSRSPKD